ncbi:MAG: OmpA family protein [Prevotella sp.]|nr:OmpA family protein [Prevotella sp.]
MKKVILMFAAAMLTMSASAQRTAVTANKAGDNWYVGINAGAATPMQKWQDPKTGKCNDAGFMKGISPKVGVRVGKNLTTVFGLAADADMYFMNKTESKSWLGSKTFVNAINVDLLATFNLSNLFAGYKGQPRTFEVIALGGFGWSHGFGAEAYDNKADKFYSVKDNGINSKVALDFALNLGQAKAWQVYLEPAVVFGLWHNNHGALNYVGTQFAGNNAKYDSRAGIFQVSVGANYKFGTSNGTHNFVVEQLRDQAEIDGLNAQINGLRAENDAKDGQLAAANKTIADLKAQLAACEARPTTVVEAPKENVLQPHVIFRQGKSVIDAAQYASIEMVAKYMKNHKDAKVKVQGYASPEGSKEFNQKLSEQRAEVVKNALVKKYKIAADRITTEGLGATDKISSENDFNRVAMFIDTTTK